MSEDALFFKVRCWRHFDITQLCNTLLSVSRHRRKRSTQTNRSKLSWVLHVSIKVGKPMTVGLSLVVSLVLYTLLSSSLGWLSVPLAFAVGTFLLIAVLGIVELIKLVTEFLTPE